MFEDYVNVRIQTKFVHYDILSNFCLSSTPMKSAHFDNNNRRHKTYFRLALGKVTLGNAFPNFFAHARYSLCYIKQKL
jgi:hypothetical protein